VSVTAPSAEHEPLQVKRTRTSATWVSVAIAVVFLILLVVFIAQNNRDVPLHFFGASGTVSEALALIVAALGGAALVLAIGGGRIAQLRLGGRRHNRSVARQQAEVGGAPMPTDPPEPGSD
jgi:lipopolysaccharide assembly protein A